MALKKRKITKLTVAFGIGCLLTITPGSALSTSGAVLFQKVEQLLQQGYDAVNARRVEEAESIFRQVIKIDPNNAEAYYNLGIALGQQRKLEEAVANFQQVIKLNPNNAEAYTNLGILLVLQWKLKEGIAKIQQAIEIDPNNAEAYNHLGLALQQQGKLEEAISNYQQAIDIDSDNIRAQHGIIEAKRLLELSEK